MELGKHFLARWLLRLSVPKKLHIFLALIVIVFFAAFLGLWLVTDTLSSLRAYVGAESLWSKAQNQAAFSLYRYSISSDEIDYLEFDKNLKVLLGFRKARQELINSDRNFNLVKEGFLEAGVDPNDISGIARLFSRFRTTSYMRQTFITWGEGDALVQNLQETVGKMHEIISNSGPILSKDEAALLEELSFKTLEINSELELLGKDFSFALGEASRQIKNILFFILTASITLLAFVVLFIAVYVSRMIANVDKAKTEFVSIASHQLRTPIAIINWYTERLLRDFKNMKEKDSEKSLTELYRASRRMSDLVDALLSASRIELGTLAVNPKPTDVLKIARKAIYELKPSIATKKINFEFNHDDDIPLVNADPKILEIIFNNLISNAVKYTPENGDVNFAINKDTDGVLIKVADTGYGIAEQEKKKVFTKLFRSDRMKENGIDGTGLGLYIVKYAVEQSKGEIWFKSKENLGSTFYVKFSFAG